MVARFSCDLLGPVPVAELEISARVLRPGRRVELIEAVARSGGRDVARASAWRVLRTSVPPVPPRLADPPSLERATPAPLPGGWGDGYLSAVEWRRARGDFDQPGPAAFWARLRYPLVAGEATGPLERVLAIADSGSGVSGELDLTRWLFINPELTLHVHREAVGEWICLDGQTAITSGGVGLATTVVSDGQGPLGLAAQSLLVTPRPRGEAQ